MNPSSCTYYFKGLRRIHWLLVEYHLNFTDKRVICMENKNKLIGCFACPKYFNLLWSCFISKLIFKECFQECDQRIFTWCQYQSKQMYQTFFLDRSGTSTTFVHMLKFQTNFCHTCDWLSSILKIGSQHPCPIFVLIINFRSIRANT